MRLNTFRLTPESLATLRQYLATIISGLSFAIVGNAAGWPSPTLIKMQNHEAPVRLDAGQVSWMVSVMYLGHLTSPIPSGLLMDRYGRKAASLLLSILPLMSWSLIWLTSSIGWLYVARYIAGLWAGATSTVVPVYVGEIADPKLRASLSVFNHLMRNFGVLVVYVVGPYVSYTTLALSCTTLTLVYIVSFTFMPESPYYLLMKNRDSEAHRSLNWLRGGRGSSIVNDEIRRIKHTIKQQLEVKGSFKDIWYNKGNRKALIISEVYAVSKRMTGAGVLQAYVSVTLPPLTLGYLTPDGCVILLGLVSLLSSMASVILSNCLARRLLISLSSAACGVTMAFVSVLLYKGPATTNSDWLFVWFILYNAAFSLGLGPVGTSVKGEMFAANVKAMSSSITTILVAVTSFLLNKFFLIIANSFGMHVNFAIYSMSAIFAVIFTLVYVPETQGKSLEEIQHLLQGNKKVIDSKMKNKQVN